jgi:hypothetical protein
MIVNEKELDKDPTEREVSQKLAGGLTKLFLPVEAMFFPWET